jgi:Rrf2 family protein
MRLELTRKSDLAVRSLLLMAEQGERMKSSELAKGLGATPAFVPQVVAPLIERRWVGSDPGPAGGYTLLAELETLTVLEVIEAVEGPTESGRCALDGEPCAERGTCVVHEAWQRARALLLADLAATTVADVAGRIWR